MSKLILCDACGFVIKDGAQNPSVYASDAIAELEAKIERLREAIQYALDHSHEDNYLMVLHWDAHEKLKKALQEDV